MAAGTNTRQTVLEILSDIAPEIESESDLDVKADLREEVDLDSMDFLNLITALSEQFEFDIPQSDYVELLSFDDIVRYVEDKISR